MMSDDDINNLKAELRAYEERWVTTFNRLDDIDKKLDQMESRQLTMGGAIICFLAGLVVTLVMAM